LKGTLAVFIANLYVRNFPVSSGVFFDPNILIVLAAFFVIFGHCFSFILHFRGGKGGATTAGVILYLDPFIFLVLLFIWLLVVATTRFTSLGNLIGVIVIPIFMFYRSNEISVRLTDISSGNPYIGFSLILTIFIYFMHRTNIKNLLGGYERKIGEKS
jgi:acyl phosphate:glycerol-3-phosphate acyltransferase